MYVNKTPSYKYSNPVSPRELISSHQERFFKKEKEVLKQNNNN